MVACAQPKLFPRSLAALGVLALAGTGCTVVPTNDDNDAGAPVFTAHGQVTGAGGGGVLAVVFSVTSGNPDYAYRFGKAAVTGGKSFIVSFSSEPPAAALNSDGIGVGYVALFPLGSLLADGELPSDLIPLGYTAQHAIIYRQPESKAERWWSGQFPSGYGCGVCAPPPAGQTLEGYKPAVCSSLELVISPGDDCKWSL
jgi:hypothetical protein